MDQEFKRHIQEIGDKMKQLLDLATEREWVVNLIIDKWDVYFTAYPIKRPYHDFVWHSRFIEMIRYRKFVEQFGWDQYAIDFAREALYYWINRSFEFAKESLRIDERVTLNERIEKMSK